MATITLSMPDPLRKKMKQHDSVNWSAVARDAVEQHLAELERKERLRRLVRTEEKAMAWTIELGERAKKEQLKELRKKGYDV